MSVLHVVFKVDGAEYALPAADVLQMESFTGATPVPGAPSHVAGLVQVRGRVIPVVDARARFGLPPVERTLDSRVVVGQLGDRTVGLLVDSAREKAKDPEGSIRRAREWAEQSQDYLEELRRWNDENGVFGEEWRTW